MDNSQIICISAIREEKIDNTTFTFCLIMKQCNVQEFADRFIYQAFKILHAETWGHTVSPLHAPVCWLFTLRSMARGEAIEVKKHIQDYVKLRIDFKSSFFVYFIFCFQFYF